MKKALLSTTVLLALAVTSVPAAAQTKKAPAETLDQPIELKVGGFMSWYATYANQRKSTFAGPITPVAIGDYNHYDIMGNAEVYFSGSTTLSNGVKIGAMVQLEAGTDSATTDQVIDEAYMTVDTSFGRFIVGNVKNVSNQMSVLAPDTSTLAMQESDFRRLISVPVGFSYNKSSYASLDDISTKFSYITPTLSGFTFGVSLMPGNSVKGQDADNLLIGTNRVKPFKHGADTTLVFEHDFGSFNLSTSASYTMYKPNMRQNGVAVSKEQDIHQYGGGLSIKAGNLTVGGSYFNVNMKREIAAALNNVANIANGEIWDFGIQYAAGPYEFGLNFYQSRAESIIMPFGKDIFTFYEASAKYKIISGVNAFVDIGYLDFDSATPIKGTSNKGVAIATGMTLAF